MKRRMLSLVLCFSVIGCLAGCQDKGEDYGEITNVKIQESPDEKYEEDLIFVEAKDDLGYAYKEIDSKRAQMKFKIPKDWTVRQANQRYIQVVSPNEDPLLPGATLNIQHDFSPLPEYGNNTPSEFESLFTTERGEMKYTLDGEDGFVHSYMGSPTKVVEHTEISSQENNNCLCVYEDAGIFKYMLGNIAPYKCTALYDYVKWKDLPHCFSIVCNAKYQENAEKLLTYILSSIKLSKAKVGATKEETINGVTLTVPKEFERIEKGKATVLRASLEKTSYFSGCALAVVELGEVSINNEYMQELTKKDGKAAKICKDLLGAAYTYMLYPMGDVQTVSVGGKSMQSLPFTCDIFASGSFKDPMPPVTNGYLNLYCFDNKDGGTKAIAVLTGFTPEDAVFALDSLIKNRTII